MLIAQEVDEMIASLTTVLLGSPVKIQPNASWSRAEHDYLIFFCEAIRQIIYAHLILVEGSRDVYVPAC